MLKYARSVRTPRRRCPTLYLPTVAELFAPIMEIIVWTAILVAAAAMVWAFAPYHQRIIDHRETVIAPEDWD